MNKIKRYQRYQKFKSHFKNIPIVSNFIRIIKWKYHRPLQIKKYTRQRIKDYDKKMAGIIRWTNEERSLLALKNTHRGEIAFIVGNGPSLSPVDLDKLKERNIFCFGMNRITLMFDKTLWRPHCYMAIDRQIYRDDDPTINCVIKENLPLYLFSESVYHGIPKSLHLSNVIPFNSKPNSHYIPITEFSDNAMLYVVDGFTVTYSAMQLAYFMGFKEVYLLGVDFNYSRIIRKDGLIVAQDDDKLTYFDRNYDPQNKNAGFMEGMLQSYETAQKFCDNHDFRIINLTRGGKLDVFERDDFDRVINQL